jgi:heme A synthase
MTHDPGSRRQWWVLLAIALVGSAVALGALYQPLEATASSLAPDAQPSSLPCSRVFKILLEGGVHYVEIKPDGLPEDALYESSCNSQVAPYEITAGVAGAIAVVATLGLAGIAVVRRRRSQRVATQGS